MTPPHDGTLSWDVRKIAEALKINEDDVREYFTDGRRVSFIIERRLANEVIKGTLAPYPFLIPKWFREGHWPKFSRSFCIVFRPHRLVAQDGTLSRYKHGFDSRWGRHLIRNKEGS